MYINGLVMIDCQIAEYAALVNCIKQMENQKNAIRERIIRQMTAAKIDTMEGERYRMTYMPGGGPRLDVPAFKMAYPELYRQFQTKPPVMYLKFVDKLEDTLKVINTPPVKSQTASSGMYDPKVQPVQIHGEARTDMPFVRR